MNSSTRDQIFAAKEKLHRLTEKAREEDEKMKVTAKAKEEVEYLKKHNKTMKQVLNQAARLNRGEEEIDSSEVEGSEGEEEEESLDEKSQGEGRRLQREEDGGITSTVETNKMGRECGQGKHYLSIL